jgi:hypothetical protein
MFFLLSAVPLLILVGCDEDQSPSQSPLVSAKWSGIGFFDQDQFDNLIVISSIHGNSTYFLNSLYQGLQRTEETKISPADFKSAMLRVAEGVEFHSSQERGVKLGVPHTDPKLSIKAQRIGLVQLGNIPNIGNESFICFKILASIEEVIGWKVIQLYGKEEAELFNLAREFKYRPDRGDLNITDEDVRGYKSDGTGTLSDVADAFKPHTGGLWKFLTTNSVAVARVGSASYDGDYALNSEKADTIFVHAGIEPVWLADLTDGCPKVRRVYRGDGNRGILDDQEGILPGCSHDAKWEKFLSKANDVLKTRFTEGFAMALEDTGPLRTFRLTENSEINCTEVTQVLAKLQASRIVVGRDPESKRKPYVSCDGRLLNAGRVFKKVAPEVSAHSMVMSHKNNKMHEILGRWPIFVVHAQTINAEVEV